MSNYFFFSCTILFSIKAYAESINREQENYRETYKTLLQEMEYLRGED